MRFSYVGFRFWAVAVFALAPASGLCDNCGLPAQYLCAEISRLDIVDSSQKGGSPLPTPKNNYLLGKSDLITNGGFCNWDWQKNRVLSISTVVNQGKVVDAGLAKSWNRGGIAVDRDGRVHTCRIRGAFPGFVSTKILAAIRQSCGPNVISFSGGGAMLIENGKAVPGSDINNMKPEGQKFSPSVDRFDSASSAFRKTAHIVLAEKGGQTFVILAYPASAKEIQARLVADGFTSAVKFDGGHQTFAQAAGTYQNRLKLLRHDGKVGGARWFDSSSAVGHTNFFRFKLREDSTPEIKAQSEPSTESADY